MATTKELGAINPVVAVPDQLDATVELDPRLISYKADYDNSRNPLLKSKLTWAKIQLRLLANKGHYLALAQAMEQGGELFGVDKKGNPLICDRGDGPIMNGMDYENTRDRVLYKHDSYDKDGKMTLGEDSRPIKTGYEMFPYSGEHSKSLEISQYETHTGKPFVKSLNCKEWSSSWVESGENPSCPRVVYFNPNLDDTHVAYDEPKSARGIRGVRRLLRVKKAA